jgi:Spy/CpxP family protein refolding chaperone
MRYITVLAGVLTLTATLSAQVSSPTLPIPDPTPTFSFTNLQKYLNLTDAQEASLVAIATQQAQAVYQVGDQIAQKNQALYALLASTNPNPAQVGQLMIDIQNLEKQLAPSAEPYHSQALAVLNSTQISQLTDLSTALQLAPTAYEAINANLIAPPGYAGTVVPLPALPGGVMPARVQPRR